MSGYSFTAIWRRLLRNKTYNLINIAGLAAGLASFILILLYLNYELSYDKWHPALQSVSKITLHENGEILQNTPAPLAAALSAHSANVEAATAIMPAGDFELLLANGEKQLYQKGVVMADASFLKVFPYELVAGNKATALEQPDAIILTETVSRKLFGDADPVGKRVKVYNAFDVVVTGIMKEPATPSHLNVQAVMRDPNELRNRFWTNYSFQTYIKTRRPMAAIQLENDINRVYYNERLKKDGQSFETYRGNNSQTWLSTEAVARIHNFPRFGSSNFTRTAVILLLAVLLLVAGAINFSNFAIAGSIRRAKEVGMRKVLGANRYQLIINFMYETAIQCAISLLLAIGLVYFTLPYFNRSFDLPLSLWRQSNMLSIAAQVTGCLLLVVLLSGLYPAIVLSRFNATGVLKGEHSSGRKGVLVRNGLIVLQFAVAACFITAVLVINGQLHFMQWKDKGFSGGQVMRIQATQKTRDNDFAAVRERLLSIKGVEYVAKTTAVPGDKMLDTSTYAFKYKGREYRMVSIKVSADYFQALHVGLQQGRLFNNSYADENTRTAIINETAAKRLNITDPAGKTISFPGCDSIRCEIAGIVRDFNVQGYESSIQPVVYTIGNNACVFQSGGAMLVKLNNAGLHQTLSDIEREWKKIEPGFPIKYSFVDDNFQQLFISHVRLQKIVSFFAVIAILISITGLFALTALLSGQRAREIGIRKVLGASVSSLTALLSRDFIRLVLLAVLIAVPFTWWAMNKWLETFAYRITISWWMLLAAGMITAVIALVTVGFQTIKAALVNPVKSLRSE
jgi:putative ABC transport system permease protein